MEFKSAFNALNLIFSLAYLKQAQNTYIHPQLGKIM